MSKVAFVHIWSNPNVGDKWCSPKSYFDFGPGRTQSFGQPVGSADIAIYGGGNVFKRVAYTMCQHASPNTQNVVWGVGINRRHTGMPQFKRMARRSALLSSRIKGVPGCDWVPCVSAMADIFDEDIQPTRDVVLFSHAEKSAPLKRVDGIPEMTNYHATMREAVRFIGSAETVVTNSYHGTFWAMCLGRKVLCVPFSNKFTGFSEDPVKAAPDDWHRNLHLAERREGVLEHARARNRAFYEKVRSLQLDLTRVKEMEVA